MCDHLLGILPCTNLQPHAGNGHGCTHDAGDVADRHIEPEDD